MDRIGFFHAGFRDGRVQIAGKSYPAGFFSVFLLNNYYKDDTAARIAVFVSSNLAVQNELSQGLVSVSDFCACAGEIEHSSLFRKALRDRSKDAFTALSPSPRSSAISFTLLKYQY